MFIRKEGGFNLEIRDRSYFKYTLYINIFLLYIILHFQDRLFNNIFNIDVVFIICLYKIT